MCGKHLTTLAKVRLWQVTRSHTADCSVTRIQSQSNQSSVDAIYLYFIYITYIYKPYTHTYTHTHIQFMAMINRDCGSMIDITNVWQTAIYQHHHRMVVSDHHHQNGEHIITIGSYHLQLIETCRPVHFITSLINE